MVLKGIVLFIDNDRIRIRLVKSQEVDIFYSESRKDILDRIIVGAEVTLSVGVQGVNILENQLGKFWLLGHYYELQRRKERKEKGSEGSWFSEQAKNNAKKALE